MNPIDWQARALAAESLVAQKETVIATLVDSIETYGDEYAKNSMVWHDRDGMHCSICQQTWDRDSQAGYETHAKDCPIQVAKNSDTAATSLLNRLEQAESANAALREQLQSLSESVHSYLVGCGSVVPGQSREESERANYQHLKRAVAPYPPRAYQAIRQAKETRT